MLVMFAVSAMLRGERPEIRLAKPPGAVAARDAQPAKDHAVFPGCGFVESRPSRDGLGLVSPDETRFDLVLVPAGVPAVVGGDHLQSPGANPRSTALRDYPSPLFLGTPVCGGFNFPLLDCRYLVARAQRTSVFRPSICTSRSALNSTRRRVDASIPQCCSAPLFCASDTQESRKRTKS